MIVHKPVIVFVLSLVLTGFSACSPRALHEAEEVVRTADSLRAEGKMYGIDEGDSATLAQAYETLGKQPFVLCTSSLCTSYAHACYHYGRLLREKDNPVAAMECFINATHTRTRDYHIIGRVYSNMGDICHLAGEFQRAYDMYDYSASMYMRNGDTLLYYYDLNNMAFEVALLGDKDRAYHILNEIDCQMIDDYAKMKITETKAEACLCACQYDSAIYYTSILCSQNNQEATGLLIRAQAYSHLEEKDSAVFYANKVLSMSSEIYNANNALYILTNKDDTKDTKAIREVASNRADVQKLIEIKRSKLTQAVQLLEQDLRRKPNLVWLYAVLATLLITGSFASVYIYHKHRKHQLLSQHISDLEGQNQETQTRMRNNVEERCALYRASQHIANDLCCTDYDKMCQIADQQFYMIASKLRSKQILNQTEVRLCILVLIDLNRIGLSKALPYSISGVGKLKDHTAKELGTTGKNLRDFLLKLAIEG